METPSEWAKRFNQHAGQTTGAPSAQTQTVESPPEFPSEPFPCPACGQMLAPACRVCVACKHAIDPAEIARPQSTAPAPSAAPTLPPVRYPWRIFFAFLGVSFFLALSFEALWGEQRAQFAMGGVQTLVGVWVFFDAIKRGVPRSSRWGLGSMLLPVVVFPWYLARRRVPQAPVPFVEREVGPVTRFLLIALLLFFLISLIFYIVEGPPPGINPAPPSKERKIGGESQPRITRLRLKGESGKGWGGSG